jgi:hypothetical protein
MGQNIGKVGLEVWFMNKSPFGGQPKQEVAWSFSEDNFKQFKSKGCFPLPRPINGIRLEESLKAYHNFLEDSEGNPLETATYKQTNIVQDGESTVTKTSQVPQDSTATAVVEEVKPDEEDGKTGSERDFFTWQVSDNLFVESPDNPPPGKFTDPPQITNAPEFVYVANPRPGDNTKTLVLTPFMKTNPWDNKKAVHWGCKTKNALAKNQPFEVTYDYCLRDPSVPKDVPVLETRFNFVTQKLDEEGNPQNVKMEDLNLASSLYVAIQTGIGTEHEFLFLFKNDVEPMFFQLQGSGETQDAVLLAQFTGFNASKLFDPNNKFFTVKIEPVLGSLVIRSNIFDTEPWLIVAPTTRPVFIGKGPIAVYGGNVQAAFSFRPVQYVSSGDGFSGTFSTPDSRFTFASSDAPAPTLTTALKGGGEVQQNQSGGSEGAGEPRDPDQGEVHMVDAELVNGEDVQTVLEADSEDASKDVTGKREVNLELVEVQALEDNPPEGGERLEKTYRVEVSMKAGDMEQGNGYVVLAGRSPYIWMVRVEVDPGEAEEPAEVVDISCDVMSVDLNWNATSYNEMSHTGSIKVLNRFHPGSGALRLPPEGGGSTRNYRDYINRTIYVRIRAYWKGGHGHDPGGLERAAFEGMTTRATVDTQADRETVTFQVEDYMNALHHSKFVLSPFYDGMRASLAVRDIVLQSGFPEGKILLNNGSNNAADDFGLPFSNPFEEPQFKFKDGSSYKEAILRIAKLDFKSIFFDRLGKFRYETMPGGLFADTGGELEFFSSPNHSSGGANPKQMVWNMVSFTRLINDVYNVIQVNGVDKKLLARITGAVAYKEGIKDPTAEGYLGYRKHLMIHEPAIGGIDALFRYLDNYRRRVFIPPLTARFETFGFTGLQPLMIIRLDGSPLRILNVTSHMDAAANQFWMNVEGEWFYSVGKLDGAPPE